jgi:phosphotransacetylase
LTTEFSNYPQQADILLVPDLEADNMLAKQLSDKSGAERAGIVLDARAPIVLTSRPDFVRTRLGFDSGYVLVANALRNGTFLTR